MPRGKQIDVAYLFALWADHTLERCDIARRLRISTTHLVRLASRYKLPPRPYEHKSITVDPTPEEIAERARECRERHFAQRRAEAAESTRTKAWKWQKGICQPTGGRHA